MRKSSQKNYSPAFQRLGLYYSQANAQYADQFGIKSDNAISHEYTVKALQFDFENYLAMYDLWVDFSKGNGVDVDNQKAQMYYQMAKNKLDELSFEIIDGIRYYANPLAHEVWGKLKK